MNPTRARKFRRWAQKGSAPKGAPLSEKRAFGGYMRARTRRARASIGIEGGGKVERYETRNTRGVSADFMLEAGFNALADLTWRAALAKFVDAFRKRHRGKVVFFRLGLQVATFLAGYDADVVDYPEGDDIDVIEYILRWFGSRQSSSLRTAVESVDALCTRLDHKYGDLPPYVGWVDQLHVYTVRYKRGRDRSKGPGARRKGHR